ncbi:hypothetical protein AHMF7605_16335 [Adhaeribacter arboris]|uniref:Outer membrane protein beta-barrel domain-containing protein n=1 Tax=Adhaeribacter arboris TaxID=2072846 RepID=A0A2T2YHI4_9BACT|nr:porin family protein [Adhaeribacter arboris]PSR54960.1 hypothetical protein AHMF7605_16335 [Adhaeribacter arboris]
MVLKNVGVLGLLLLICHTTVAQSNKEVAKPPFSPETSFGVKAGLMFSQTSFTPAVAQEINKTIMMGVLVKHVAQPKLGVQVELNYIRNGWTLADTISNTRKQLSYLELPVLTQVAFSSKKSAFLLNIGPYASFLLSKRDTLLFKERADLADFKVVPQFFDYGLTIGLGFMRKTKLGNFQLDTRFYFGLGNLFTNQLFSISQRQSLVTSLSYFVNRKKK